MTISDNLKMFAGSPVVDFVPGQPLPVDTVPRVRLDWESAEGGTTLQDLLKALLEDAAAADLSALVIGAWDFESSHDASEWIPFLCESAPRFPRLRALMLGDITFEETEISWIQQSNIGPLLEAYPRLEHLQVRGGEGLDIDPARHPTLQTLIVETGGLPRRVIQRVAQAELPELRHLELWLGSDNYGYDASNEDLASLLQEGLFPKLRHLGLRNAEAADQVALVVAGSPVVAQLEVLDLSLGTLGDEGARALLGDGRLSRLKRLDIHHHYLSQDSVDALMALGIDVDASDTQQGTEDERYCVVSE